MSTNKKLSIIIFIAIIIFAVYFFYRKTHPRFIFVPKSEVELTIKPGWNLRQVASYLVEQGFASSTQDVYKVTGEPARLYVYRQDILPPYPITALAYKPTTSSEKITWLEEWKPENVSYEGYLAPETYRVFSDAFVMQIIAKFVKQRDKEFTTKMGDETSLLEEKYNDRGLLNHPKEIFEVITMASIIEKEVKFDSDRAMVADILWRRVKNNWSLQVDSSVHYATGKTGDVFTTDKERKIDSPWNTYKYKGLPPGPICNPSVESINAALHPVSNSYWYFLSGKDGKIYYGKTLEEHNANKRYL